MTTLPTILPGQLGPFRLGLDQPGAPVTIGPPKQVDPDADAAPAPELPDEET